MQQQEAVGGQEQGALELFLPIKGEVEVLGLHATASK